MAYNRRNFLTRVMEVQELYTAKKVPEATTVGVWREHIFPEYRISLRTLEKYLTIPAKAELKKMGVTNEEQNTSRFKQTAMEFPE